MQTLLFHFTHIKTPHLDRYMTIAQKRINRIAVSAWIVSMAVLMVGCVAEDIEDCPQPFELTVRAIDTSDKDITSDGDVQSVLLFTFDETGKRVGKTFLSADEVKARKPIHIEHFGPKQLTFVAWGNASQEDLQRLEAVQKIDDVRMPLTTEDGFAQFPTDLFSGRLDRDQQYGVLELGESATIDIRRRTCQANVTVLGYEGWLKQNGYKTKAFDPTDFASAQILFGTSLDNYSIVDTYDGKPATYRLTGSIESSTGDYHIAPFRVYPPIKGDPFKLDFYVGDKCIESFTEDSRGTLLLPQIGKMLNVLIDMRSGDISIRVVVTPWNVVHQFVTY